METGKAAEKLPTHDPERPWYPRCRWCNGVIHWSWNGGWVHVAEYGSAVIKPCGDGKHEAEPESAATRPPETVGEHEEREASMSKSVSIPFADVETVRCPKCASEPGDKCWVMAGRGCTDKTKVVPHIERAIRYINERLCLPQREKKDN